MALTFHKVLVLPAQPVADGIYFVKRADAVMDIVVVAADGTPHPLDKPFELAFGARGRPTANKEIGRYRVMQTIDLEQSLCGAIAGAPADQQRDVEVRRGGELVVRYRWSPAGVIATATVLVPSVDPGDILIFTAPADQDATLADIAGTLGGRRRV